jgi:hypothetical protein
MTDRIEWPATMTDMDTKDMETVTEQMYCTKNPWQPPPPPPSQLDSLGLSAPVSLHIVCQLSLAIPTPLLQGGFLNLNILIVPDHDGGRPIEENACILITHWVYL